MKPMRDEVIRCHMIASVLAADAVMTPGEREFLRRAMDQMGLTAEEKDLVMHFEGTEAAVERALALPREQRRVIVDDMVQAALVDGKLSPHETETVRKITEAFGL